MKLLPTKFTDYLNPDGAKVDEPNAPAKNAFVAWMTSPLAARRKRSDTTCATPTQQSRASPRGQALIRRLVQEAAIDPDSGVAHSLRDVPEHIPATGVDALLQHVLSDAALSEVAAEAMKDVDASDLLKGTHPSSGAAVEASDRALRVRLLILAKEPRLRQVLMAAVRTELMEGSAQVKRLLGSLAGSPDGIPFIPQVTIGGGPMGQTIANRLHAHGVGSRNLVIDASRAGDGNFGTVREHRLNSVTKGGYMDDSAEAVSDKDYTEHPLHHSPVQLNDLNPDRQWPTAGEFGDAATLGLYAASRRGTPVLVGTRVTGIEVEKPSPTGLSEGPAPAAEKTGARRNDGKEVADQRGKKTYIVTMRDHTGGEYKVRTHCVVDATGAGEPAVHLDSRDPKEVKASLAHIDEQTARIRMMGRHALPDQKVVHSEDFLRACVGATDDEILSFVKDLKGDLAIVGWGDSACTPVLRLMQAAKAKGLPHFQMLDGHVGPEIAFPDPKIRIFGAPDTDLGKHIGGAYAPLKELGGLLRGESDRLLAIQPGPDGRCQLKVGRPEAPTTVLAGRVILAMGMTRTNEALTRSLDESRRKVRSVAVQGDDGVHGDGVLAHRLVTGTERHEVFRVGMSANMEKQGRSYLSCFGWKSLQLVDQHLAGTLAQAPSSDLERALQKAAKPLRGPGGEAEDQSSATHPVRVSSLSPPGRPDGA